jgi:transcription termination factor Rho
MIIRTQRKPVEPISVPEKSVEPVKKVSVVLPTLLKEADDLATLKKLPTAELIQMARALGIEGLGRLHKKDIIFALLKERAKRGEEIIGSGVLEILPDGFGFLRSPESSYLAGADDIYLLPSQIRRFSLRTGDTVVGESRPPKSTERYFALLQVRAINQEDPLAAKNKVLFENLTPLYPNERIVLERKDNSSENITGRVIDLIAPLGKGQRGLILSPPKAGKTMMLKNIAQSITLNHPECYLIVLLIGERPEEVTDMQRSINGEVVASTFDEPAKRHIQLAEMVIEKAKRLVEHKRDVVILMDSMTRLARAYNTVTPSSGKVLTGGIDANAVQPLKRFFGAARNIEEGGSLTLLSTILVDTGSKMEDVIYEELKGTGNWDIRATLELARKGIYPSFDWLSSGTRRADQLVSPAELQNTWILRKILHTMDVAAGMEFLIERLLKTKTNEEFFDAMKK